MNPMQSTAGRTQQEPEGYLAFHPNPLPPHPAFTLDEEGVLALANADHYLGQLAGKALSIPNPDLFVGDLTADVINSPGTRGTAGSGHVLYSAATLKNRTFDLNNLPAGVVMTTFLGGGGGDILADTALDGDFDGDGIDDLAFSSPHADPFSRSDAGTLHVFHGQNGVWPSLVDLKPANLPAAADVVGWLVTAAGSGIVGLVAGAITAAVWAVVGAPFRKAKPGTH